MKIGVNPYITTPKYQKRQTAVSFTASVPKKIQSEKIFELKSISSDKYFAKLKELAHIDINSRNFAGDTLITDSAKEGGTFLNLLMKMEQNRDIEGIDWNATNASRDNIIMIALKNSRTGLFSMRLMGDIEKLAAEGKIDVNYVNTYSGYSLMDCALDANNNLGLASVLRLKGLDVNKSCYSEPILHRAIDKAISPRNFRALICHPSFDISKYDSQELFQYIDSAPSHWDAYNNDNYKIRREGLYSSYKDSYKEAVLAALQMQIVSKIKKYYQENGMLTLNQIQDFIKNVFDEETINMPLNEIGENIGHFIAEIYIEADNTIEIQKVKNIITELAKNNYFFGQEDEIGRTPLMIALEAENLIVAKALLETMNDKDLIFCNFVKEYGFYKPNHFTNHVPIIRELINKLQPKDREEFTRLLEICLKDINDENKF